MEQNPHVMQLHFMQEYFNNATSSLEEADSGFAPREEMLTVAQQVAHTAQTVDWFLEGAWSPDGFDMDFEKIEKQIRSVTSLEAARKWFAEAMERAVAKFGAASEEELMTPMQDKEIMGGAPRIAALSAMADHTAHHRGSLVVYIRLLDKVPGFPYGEMG